jgi:hypothetical protein
VEFELASVNLRREGELTKLRVVVDRNERLLREKRPPSEGLIAQLRNAISETRELIADLESGGDGNPKPVQQRARVLERRPLFAAPPSIRSKK